MTFTLTINGESAAGGDGALARKIQEIRPHTVELALKQPGCGIGLG